MTRRSFSTDFKFEAAGPALDQGYSIPEACKSMGVGPNALRRWGEQLRSERGGTTPARSKAMESEQKRIQDLEAHPLQAAGVSGKIYPQANIHAQIDEDG